MNKVNLYFKAICDRLRKCCSHERNLEQQKTFCNENLNIEDCKSLCVAVPLKNRQIIS